MVHPAVVTDAQVKARYDSVVASLGDLEYKMRTMQLPDDATANGALAKLKVGQTFDELAKQLSRSPDRVNGGDLGWVGFRTPLLEGHRQGLPLPLAQAITKLPPGNISASPIVVGKDRFQVMVEAARATQIPPLDQARPQIRR
ncbi:peptidylprolyl isomerase [Paraburkholderia phytofirmans]